MAELTNQCCTPAARQTCCEPSEKASCCDATHGAGCGCAAGAAVPSTGSTATVELVRETVREKYAAAALAAAPGAGCCSPADETGVFGSSLYARTGESGAPDSAVNASLGLRRADRCRRSARRRGGVGSWLGRGRGCVDLGAAGRADRSGDRARHDR